MPHFRTLVEHSSDGLLIVGVDGRVRFANGSAAEMLRRPSAQDAIGYPLGYPSVTDDPVELVLDPGGEERTVELRASEVSWEGQPALLVNLREITTRARQAKHIEQLNSVLRTVLDVEDLILRERDAESLLRGACEVLVQRRRYDAASIVLHDSDGHVTWTTEASHGKVRPSLAQPPCGAVQQIPCCQQRAFDGSGDVVRWQTPTESCGDCPVLAGCAARTRIVAVIASEDQRYGVLTLASTELLVEQAEEEGLLARMAANLGRSLRAIRLESAQKLAEAQLSRSEARFRKLFESSVDAILIADAKGRFSLANPAACELLGHERETLLTKTVADLLVPRGHASAGSQYARFVSASEANGAAAGQAGTFEFMRGDGERRVAEYSAFPLSDDEYVSILRDATARINLEEELRQSQKMEAVGTLAGGIAHDFNNALTVITSFAGFIQADTEHTDPRYEDVKGLLRAADRASSLTRQLLAFSRKEHIAPKNVDLNDLLLVLDKMLRRTLPEDVEIVTLPGDGLWPTFIDPGKFEQVVMNLVINARDAMPEGGKLVIETRNEPANEAREQECVLLAVEDTGVGMTAEVKAQVLEPFFTTKATGAGTGLGLSTVYGLVSQAGGTVSIESTPGRGSRFEIRLPRAQGSVERATKRSVSAVDARGTETILLVEDEPLVREATRRILSRYGYHVLEASNGAEAVANYAASNEVIDLLLSDMVMPQLNGRATAEAMLASRPGLRVLLMTGYADMELVKKGVLEANLEVLSKPFRESELVGRVRQVLDAPAAMPADR